MHPLRPPPRGLYAITPDMADTGELLRRVATVLAAGTALLQYRNKTAAPDLRDAQAAALLPLCRRHRVPLIINDDVELALRLGADGVHLGGGDGDLRAARARLGPAAIVGASCYADLARAARAADAGASYLAFGALFPSPTKPDAPRATPQLLRDAARFGLTRVAIGGITADNAGIAIAAGADLVAVISGVFDAPDPAAAVRAYRACFASPIPE